MKPTRKKNPFVVIGTLRMALLHLRNARRSLSYADARATVRAVERAIRSAEAACARAERQVR